MEEKLPLVETFHSLQGEGAHYGRSAYFIRVAGCEVGCSWCDTKDSWNENQHTYKSVQELSQKVLRAKKEGANFVVITGGEPLQHDLNPLCKAIRDIQSIPIHLETSGVNELSGNPDWITLSPKRHQPPTQELLKICQELKFIIHEEVDIKFAQNLAKHSQSINFDRPLLFMQPGWQSKKGIELTVDFIKKNPEWRMSIQTHKWLEIN